MAARVTSATIIAKLDEMEAQHSDSHAALDVRITEISDSQAAQAARLDALAASVKPISDFHANVTGARRVLLWLFGALAAAGAGAAGLREILRFVKH